MSVGKSVARARRQAKKTQRELARASGLAASHLSRLENDRLTPTAATLGRIADALGQSVAKFFEAEGRLDTADRCPVSLDGKCVLDHSFVAQGRRPNQRGESYSARQLEALRLCNFLLHQPDLQVRQAFATLVESLLALSEHQAKSRRLSKPPARDRSGS